jgi:pimeloyl-ACP methyl ester carboxylesterase
VIAPSLRHYYPERWNGAGDDFTIEQQAADMAKLIKALDLGKVHLIGWSRGGRVAMEVALAAPEVLRSLIFEDATIVLAGAETDDMKKANVAAAARQEALRVSIQAGDAEGGARNLVDALNGPGAWDKLPADRRSMMLDNIYTGLALDYRRPISLGAFADLGLPLLLVTGENSPAFYRSFYDEIRKVSDLGETVVIPGAAHLMHLDNPEAFSAAVLRFVAEH